MTPKVIETVREWSYEHSDIWKFFFEKDNKINTSSYFIKKTSDKTDNPVEWEFFIPISELDLAETDTGVNVLINYVTFNPGSFTLSRRYNKDTYPLKAKFTGFKDALPIQIRD